MCFNVFLMRQCVFSRRNDPIKHVREAAELALSRSGGLKAQEAMKVTRVLTSEVEALRMSSKRSEKS